jgi:AraC-type DNA-binding domain-containing proteins
MYLQETGELHAKKPHINKRENLASFLFFIVQSGSGTLTCEEREYSLSQGDCVFIDCRKAYSHRSSSDLWDLRWVHFYGANMNGIYAKYLERCGQPCFHAVDATAFEKNLDELFRIASSEDFVRDMRIFECLTGLLTQVMSQSWQPVKRAVTNLKKQNLTKVRVYLDEHFKEKISLECLSELFFINKFYLTRIFKEQFGVSITTYLLQKKITKAKQLLRFSDNNIESIGIECGLGEPYYFSRMFKKVEGISPTEYRQSWFG